MALFISPLSAAAIMLPVLCMIDLPNLWNYRKNWHSENIIVLLPGAMLGIVIGSLTFRLLDDNLVRILLGVLTLFFSLTYFFQSQPLDKKNPFRILVGVLCGILSGFTSFVAHAGGAPMKFFLLPQRLEKKVFVGTHVIFFFIINQVKIWPYFWLGQFTLENLITSLILSPAVPLGVIIGWKINKVLSIEFFYKICYFLLFFTGIKLIWDGFSHGI